MTKSTIPKNISEIFERIGFSRFGYASLNSPISLNVYKQWLKDGFHGEMQYLERHLPEKEHPQKLLPQAYGAFVVAIDYHPVHPEPGSYSSSLLVAGYAKGLDYHHWLKQRLQNCCEKLKELYPQDEFIAMTDSSPVLERDLAYRAGLGWVGKNTCLIDQRQGSLFLIGEIYTTLSLNIQIDPAADRCGNCTRCIEACPTQAIIEPRKLDARKCISYLTIESKNIPEKELRFKVGAHYFGCDICQTVCPWNQKVFGTELSSKNKPDIHNTEQELRDILESSHSQIEKRYRGTALSRTPPWAHKRNALMVIANLKLTSLKPYVANLMSHEKLGDLARWTIENLES